MNVAGLIGLQCSWGPYETLVHHKPGDGEVVGGFFDPNLGACILAIPTGSREQYRPVQVVPVGHILVDYWDVNE